MALSFTPAPARAGCTPAELSAPMSGMFARLLNPHGEITLNPVKIGFLGFGTVGQGAAVVLARNAVEINRRAGRDIIVKSAAVRDTGRDRAPELAGVTLTTDHNDIVNDPEIDVVIEVMGGDEPARSLLLLSLIHI